MAVFSDLRRLMEYYPGGLYVLNHKKEYIFANSYFLSMVNLTMEELLYKNVHELMENGCYDVCISDLTYESKCAISVFSNVSIRKNGVVKKKKFLIRAIPILDDQREVASMLAICDPVDRFYKNMSEAEIRSRRDIGGDPGFTNIMAIDSEDTFTLIAKSEPMQRLLENCDRIALTDSTVLISGESGVGKEVIAEYLHRISTRKTKDMIVVNCAALPANLLEATLFGYDKGAFTDALKSGKMGLIEAADGATLFLDEISSLPMELQGKLLRTLETKTVRRIGSLKSKMVDFRLIAATNEDLMAMVSHGTFRADLYYRLNVIPLHLTPLRDRTEDIEPLFLHFLDEFNKKYHKEMMISQGGLRLLTEYSWPGNVRELKNLAERLGVMTPGRLITADDVTRELQSPDISGKEKMIPGFQDAFPFEANEDMPLKEVVALAEWNHIKRVLQRCNGNVSKAAQKLGIHRSVLYKKIQKYQS